jgi:hypothetical protein
MKHDEEDALLYAAVVSITKLGTCSFYWLSAPVLTPTIYVLPCRPAAQVAQAVLGACSENKPDDNGQLDKITLALGGGGGDEL